LEKLSLSGLGWNESFERAWSEHVAEREAARIVAVHKNRYLIATADGDMAAEVTGRLLYGVDSPLDLPTVGDWVAVQILDDRSFAVIHSVLPRFSLIKRKTPGKTIDLQLVAANIDTVFIVQAADADFNLRRLERYLVIALESNIEPVLLLSKIDQIDDAALQDRLASVAKIEPTLSVVALSNLTGQGLDQLQERLMPGRTYCLLGSSGVGKTTLLNRLLGEDLYATGEVREKDQRGRHVTTARQLSRLAGGALIIDTPGMREVGAIGQSTGIESAFSDIEELAIGCRFADCSHVHETGCAVREAVENGELDAKRYENYLKLRRESAYHERSYLEKRQKDKAFGKMAKEILKSHHKR
jgi:ribosome biogenesis GTPase